ncbi:PIR protein [Plasmodium yoelii]|uniref:PIR protein n=3 Tax=Plasmodium yoelii TaxID=5861 RepID=A0AAE9WTL0_PLAYO|nr:PIR protein [Plasmodium yoelii]EAA21265.1 putative yir4 protein [Plasmodium yoelii yoelii]WBY58355.1 PIR protein [Plasmodium yoelii yoelii]CDS44409.1 YIR protein [Plasmodium yoelii]VTZ79271.1 PIR protein [Plasmodium yoelii]|eukprot:XP_022810992.2 PIR protein [Plasmodium yoelii]
MDKQVCERFKNVREWISDELIGGKYQFKDDNFLNNSCNNNNFLNNYSCNNNNFKNELDRISAGCLYLLDEFIKDCGVSHSPLKNNINIVDYIMIWLSYMLNLGKSEEEDNITGFYIEYIHDCNKYNKKINELTDYDNYKKLLDKKNYVLNMNSNIVPKFYEAFKSLCEMYTEFDENTSNCAKRSEKAGNFIKQYEELYKDYNSTKDSSYKQVLCTLSTDYDNLIKKCNAGQYCKSSPLPTIDKTKIPENCSEETSEQLYAQGSEVASSSSSISSKLIPVLSIFSAIPIFLGIAYKYSLFGFRKRFQKQKLREKLKNVKKRMNH